MRRLISKIWIYFFVFFAGIIFGAYWIGRKYCLKLINCRNISNKHLHMIRMYDVWMMVKKGEKSIAEYLKSKGIHVIAIYGMSFMGVRLFYELQNTSIEVKYGIDCNLRMKINGLNVFHMNDIKNCDVDAVIVTAVFSFDDIKESLENIGFTNIIPLDEVLYDLI